MRLPLVALALFASCVSVSQQGPITSNAASADCTRCHYLVELLHQAWDGKEMGDCIGDFAYFICTTFKIEDQFVCKMIIGDFKDEVIYVLGQILVDPKQMCSLLLDDCGTFFDPFNATWHLSIPAGKPAHVDRPLPDANAAKLRVLHLSDIHLDMEYTVGTEAQCDEPQCCRTQQDPHELTRKVRDIKKPAGQWGTVGDCDAPYWLYTNMLENIKANHKDLDYVVVSGDLMSHADWDYTPDSHTAMIHNVSDTIRSYFPNIPVFFAVGNHEGVPIDNFAPHFTPKKFHMDYLYTAMADSWKDWAPDDQRNQIIYNGCFMRKLFPGLRLISINNALGDSMNFWLYMNQTDPDGTMTWFMNQLKDAETAGDRVHIVAHIPGGGSEALEGWAINYYNILNRFEDTIAGQFFGHTHSEEFYVSYLDPEDSTSRPTSVVYSAPSLTPYSDYNPAYRIYTIDGNYAGSSFEVLDFEEYYFNLTENNANPSNPQWKQLYASANQQYGLKSQKAAEWNNLIDRMKTDTATFDTYRQNFYRRSSYEGIGTCDDSCRMSWLCSARRLHHTKNLCNDLNAEPRVDAPKYQKKKVAYHPTDADIQIAIENYKRTHRDTDTCPL